MKKLLLHALIILNVFVLGFYLGRVNANRQPKILTGLKTKRPEDVNSLLEIINDYRISNNLTYLETDPYLCKIANERSQEIVADWSHDGFKKLDHPSEYAANGENLAKFFQTDQKVLESWLNSPTHKDILEGNYNTGCIGKTSVAGINYFALEVGRKKL